MATNDDLTGRGPVPTAEGEVMRLEVSQQSLRLIPDNEMEIGWIEGVLGLKKEGDFLQLKRVNRMSSYSLAYLIATKEQP